MTRSHPLPTRGSNGLASPVHRERLVQLADRSASVIAATANSLRYRLAGVLRPPLTALAAHPTALPLTSHPGQPEHSIPIARPVPQRFSPTHF